MAERASADLALTHETPARWRGSGKAGSFLPALQR